MKKIALLAVCAVSFMLGQERSFGVLQSGSNRYVYGQVGPARADQYLLDTQTGRMWFLTVDSEAGQQYLRPILFVQPDGKTSLTPPSTAK